MRRFFAFTLLYLDLNDEANEEETCENCNLTKPKNQILIHIGQTKACKTHYGPRFKAMKALNEKERKQRLRARIGKEKVNEQQRQAYARNQESLRQKKRERYQENQETLSKKARERAQEKKHDSDANLSKFYKDIEFGPEFICVCCHANLFETEVHDFTAEKQKSIAKKLYEDSCSKVEFKDPRGKDRKFVCKTCFKDLSTHDKMPSRSIKNGLTVEALPPDLADIDPLENTLIARYIPFLKIQVVPKSGIEKMTNRTVLVPVEPCDIMETIESTLLPRTMADSAVIPVDFKKMKDWKHTVTKGYVRPVKMVKALAHLKDCKNPHYTDVIIKCMFCPREFKEDDTDVLDHIEKCHLEAQALETTEEDTVDEINEEDEGTALPTVKEYQAQDDVSCIQANNPEVNVVFNTSSQPKKVPIKESVTGQTVILAPGEGKNPSAIMRELDFDAKAFPLKHPSGKFGLDFKRIVKLYKQQYFRARLFHYSGIFSKDNDYLFMCQQFCERASLEAQINISVQKGVMSNNSDGTKTMKCTDAFSVFKKVPGTPRFWQQKKYNLLAMVNVLGPFQWFFTFSCAEMRWPVIISTILRMRGHQVEVLDPSASTANAKIRVDNESLTDYLKKTGQTLRGIIQKETFTVTRIFDKRVKSFITNVLMDQGEKGMKLEYYMYRVEFQARLAPHIHGCAWMRKDMFKDSLIEGTFEFNTESENLQKLIDRFVTCELPEEPKLRATVVELQTHKCTQTCWKKGPKCRFGYPRLPSNETLISIPIDKTNDEEKKKLKDSKAILTEVRDYMSREEFDKNQTLEEILKSLRIKSEEYHNALRISERGKQVVLKRKPDECNINNYNQRLIGAYQANMDIQFCTDAYSVVTYICDYWSKDETGMTGFLKAAFKEAKSWENTKLLSHLKRTYMAKRQVGKCEAIYRAIPTMHLQGANIGCTFVQSGYPRNQSKFLRKVNKAIESEEPSDEVENDSEGDDNNEDDNIEEQEIQEDEFNGNDDEEKLFRVPGKKGLYKEAESICKKYAARPKGIENLTLSQFATSYTKRYKKPKNCNFNAENVSDEKGFITNHITDVQLPRYVRLSTNEIFGLRRYSSVLRLHASAKKDGCEEFFAELQLFFPWREEDLERWDKDVACLEAYQSNLNIINIVRSKTFAFPINEVLDEMKIQEALNDLNDRLDGEGAQDDADVLDEGYEEPARPTTDFSDWSDDIKFGEHNTRTVSNKFRTLELLSKENLLAITKTLVPEQRVILQKVLDLSKSVVQCSHSNLARDSPHQMGVIVHGGGGVGKSQTTKVCAQWAEQILRRAGGDQNKPRILLMAPTGMAASVIDGMTICSSLNLVYGHGYRGLDNQRLDKFRSEFEELKMIIIDEMSMVGADDLYRIHHRLTDIFNNNLPFGGISMMFVGDMLQLRPVKARFIFEEPSDENNALCYREKSLWHDLEAVTLKHNHRQGDAAEYTKALNRMRTGEHNESDVAMLRKRCISKLSKNYPHDAVHLFYTRDEVKDHNNLKLNKLKGRLYTTKYIGDYPSSYTPTITKHGEVDETGLCNKLNIKIGARVMIVLNIDTLDSLVNGALGVVLDIISDSEGKVKCIVVKFDREKVGAEQRKKYSEIADLYKEQNGTPIFKHKVTYHLSGNKQHAIKGTIIQFPIKLAFAITGHKMQGQEVKKGSKVVVNWSNILPAGLAYVMCSRSEALGDLFIAGKFDPNKIVANPKALEEAERIEEISLTNSPQVFQEPNQLLGFGFVNIRSLNKNFEFLEDDNLMKQLDIIFVTETWKDPKSDKTYHLNGFDSAFANGKTETKGKGVGVFFKKDAFIEICEEELYQFIKLKTENVTIFCLYISKGCNFSQIVQSLQYYGFYNKEENTCLIGDLNFDAAKTNDLSKYLSRLQFSQMVGRATHLDGHILDHVYVPQTKTNQVELKHHYCYYSDHDGILVSLKKDVNT